MGQRAFTLVEVVLAILIIVGIMSVLLYFYQRAAETRELVMKETEFISVGRLFFEKISTELRGARVDPEQSAGMEGSSNSITFVCTALPQVSKWIVPTNETVFVRPTTDLVRVHYGLLTSGVSTGTNLNDSLGVERTEIMLVSNNSLISTNSTNSLETAESTNSDFYIPPSMTNLLGATNQLAHPDALLTDKIKTLQFRYWDGRTWLDEWSSLRLPIGVEITISQDPPPEPTTTQSESSASEVFRRVVYLPNSSFSEIDTNSLSSSTNSFEEMLP